MDNSDQRHSFVMHFRAENQRIRERIVQVLCSFSTLPRDALSAELGSSLQALRQELVHHFREEEAEGGCLEEAVSLCPRLAPTADELERQHRELLEMLDQIVAKTQGSLTPTYIADLQHDFVAFADRLQEHEAGESCILKEAFGSDEDEVDSASPA